MVGKELMKTYKILGNTFNVFHNQWNVFQKFQFVGLDGGLAKGLKFEIKYIYPVIPQNSGT